MNLLYIEDSADAREYVTRGLHERGWKVTCCADGREGLDRALREPFDVCILDLGLPDLDGTEVLRRLRAAEIDMAILVLTARTDVSDRVQSLLAGADDYLMKPFAFEELVARIVALTRRLPQEKPPSKLEVHDLLLDHDRRKVTRGGKEVDLTRREFELLEHLMRNAGTVLSRAMITERIWGIGLESYSNAINVHINHLRKKIDQGHEVKLIHTVTGVGYILEARDA